MTLLPALVAWWGDAARSRPQRRDVARPAHLRAAEPRAPRLVLGATAVVLVAALAALPRVTFDSNPIHLRDPQQRVRQRRCSSSPRPATRRCSISSPSRPISATARGWATALRELPEVRARHDDRRARPGRAGREARAARGSRAAHGQRFRRARAHARRIPPPSRPRSRSSKPRAPVSPAARELARRDGRPARAARGRQATATATRRCAGSTTALTAGLPPRARAARGRVARRSRSIATICPRRSPSVGSRATAASSSRSRRPRTSATTPPRAASSPPCTASCRRRRGCPSSTRRHRRRSWAAFERALLYAFVMVAAIIWLVLRDCEGHAARARADRAGLRADGGVDGAVDMPFNYANIIALPLLVGIGVDNGIHVVHRMRTEDAERLFDTSTMRAVLASGLTTVASFGNLAFSSHVGTASMGILLALGLAASMAATLIVLPAWLEVWRRRSGRPPHDARSSRVRTASWAPPSCGRCSRTARPCARSSGPAATGATSRDSTWSSATATSRIRDSLRRAAAGCAAVFHVAADYRLWVADPQPMYRANVDGSVNVLEAAAASRRSAHGLHVERRGARHQQAIERRPTRTRP